MARASRLALALKTAMGQPIVGSNPTPSASTNTPKLHVRAAVGRVARGTDVSGCLRPVPTGYGCPSPVRPKFHERSGLQGLGAVRQSASAGRRLASPVARPL